MHFSFVTLYIDRGLVIIIESQTFCRHHQKRNVQVHNYFSVNQCASSVFSVCGTFDERTSNVYATYTRRIHSLYRRIKRIPNEEEKLSDKYTHTTHRTIWSVLPKQPFIENKIYNRIVFYIILLLKKSKLNFCCQINPENRSF